MKKTVRLKQLLALILAGALTVGSVGTPVFGADFGDTVVESVAEDEALDGGVSDGAAEEGSGAGAIAESEDMDVSEESNVEEYTVTLDANGGYFANEWDDAVGDYVERAEVIEKKIPVDGAVAVVPVYMEPDGQTMLFAGWSLEQGGELVSEAGEEYIPGENCVLYAVWQVEETEEIEGPETALPETNAEESIQDETNEDIQDENPEAIQEDYQEDIQDETQEENPTEFAAEGETAQEDYSQETVVEEETAQEEDSLEQVVEEETTQEEDSLNAEDSQESEESSGTDEGSEASDGASQDDQTVITEEDNQQEVVRSNPVNINLGEGTPEDFEENSIPISIGANNVDVSVEEGSLYKFVPNEDDIYTFYSEGEYDTIGTLFGEIDGDMNALSLDDNSGVDNNFSTSYELEEGKTYYLGVILADYESGSGTRAFILRVTREKCSSHNPVDGSAVVTKPACSEGGYTTYICSECGKDYTDDSTDPSGHQYDVDGICTMCGMESHYRIKNVESYTDEYTGEIHVELTYSGEDNDDFIAFVEIYEEGSSSNPLIESGTEKYGLGEEQLVNFYFDTIEDFPTYYIIKSYLADKNSGKIISNIYENNLHTKAFVELLASNPEDYDGDRTVEFSEESFGVFSENTVIIYGDEDHNTIRDYSGNTYIIENADSEAEYLVKGCEIAYFYDNDPQIIAHVTNVSHLQADIIQVETEDPVLEDVFDYLKIEENVDDAECTINLSNLPEGVTYVGEGEEYSIDDSGVARSESFFSEFENEEMSESNGAIFSEFENEEMSESNGAIIDPSYEETVSTGAVNSNYSELNETKTTLSCKQSFSLGPTNIGGAELNGGISVGISVPVRIYITQSQKSFQYSAKVSVSGTVSLSGKAEVQVPLGSYFIPIASGVFSINMDPVLFASFGGGASVSASFTSSVTCRAENNDGFKVISRSADLTPMNMAIEGTFFTGIDLVPSLNLLRKCKIIELHCKLGPKMSASLAVPKPKDELKEGDHICRRCIDGSGNLVFQLGYKTGIFGKEVNGSTTLSLKGFEFYYSFDYNRGGRGKCPHKKGKDDNDDDDDDDDDDNDFFDNIQETAEIVFDAATNKLTVVGNGYLGYILDEGAVFEDYAASIRMINISLKEDDDEVDPRVSHWQAFSSPKGHFIYTSDGTFYYESQDPRWWDDYDYYDSYKQKAIPWTDFSTLKCLGIEIDSLDIPSNIIVANIDGYDVPIINFSEGVKDIYLDDCSIKNITFPSSVEHVVIWDCDRLESLTIPEGTTHVWIDNCDNLKNVSLPNSVTYLDIEFCPSITSIIIPEGVTHIQDDAFKYSGDPSGSVTLHKNIKSIGNAYIFGENITILSNLTSIGYYAFVGTRTVTFADGVTNICFGAFQDHGGILSVIFPDTLKSIGGYAFYNCDDLTNVMIPASVTEIEDGAFECCRNLVITGYPGSFAETYARNHDIPFKVIPKSIKNAKVSGVISKSYTGNPQIQSPFVTLDGITLKNNTDFKVSYKNNTNVGTATMTITGIGNYKDTITKTFKINKAYQSITAKAAASSIAVGKTTSVSITGAKGTKSFESSDTTIATVDKTTGKVTAKKIGKVTITASSAATVNYKAASKTVTIKVVPAATTSLTAANQATGIKLTWKKVTGATGYKVYRGSTLIKTITSGSTVTYADTKANTNGGKYTFKIVPTSSYGNGLSKSLTTYRVARPAISSVANSATKKMTVKWGKNAKGSGYQIHYCTDKTFKSGNKSVSITSASTVSKVIGSLTKGKTYYVRIRTYKTVGSTKYFSGWSPVKSVKISK